MTDMTLISFDDGQPPAVQQAMGHMPPAPHALQQLQNQSGAPMPVQFRPDMGGPPPIQRPMAAQHQPSNDAAADPSLIHSISNAAGIFLDSLEPTVVGTVGDAQCKAPFRQGESNLPGVASLTPAVSGAADSSDDEDLNPDFMPSEQSEVGMISTEEPSSPTSGAAGSAKSGVGEAGTQVLSRQDTWQYLEDLQGPNWPRRVECTRALKFLAFNADSEYKDGLIRGGLCRVLVQMLSVYSADPTKERDVIAIEHAASCMYSMAREHQSSKLELIKLNAPRRLVELLSHGSKQLRLNACAALYAISCAGRNHCRDIALLGPMRALQAMIGPTIGRNAQDDQVQLFASLLIVNLLHSRGGAVLKHERYELLDSLQRAYDDTNEQQAQREGENSKEERERKFANGTGVGRCDAVSPQ